MLAIPHTPSLLRSLAGARPFVPGQRRAVPAALRPRRTVARPMDETLFRDALVRERARAERFEEPFVVARVSRDGHGAIADAWDRTVEAVSAAATPGDLIGWFEARAVIGIIRPAVSRAGDPGVRAAAADATRRDLEQRLAGTVAGCSVTTDVYDPAQQTMPAWLLTDLSRQRTAIEAIRAVVKRAVDIVGSAAMLVLLAPLMVVVAVLVKVTSPGPVLFRQERVGAGGRVFRMNKFRTIRADADATIHQRYVEMFIEAGARKPGGEGATCKIVDDPRVTPIGRFLRRWSIDEVPQFWNVLIGEMSLVGPRPALPYEVAHYKPWHRRRFDATPGMTGLWQVSGRSRTSFDEMVEIDLRYARNHTILNDLSILAATPRAVWSGRGAH